MYRIAILTCNYSDIPQDKQQKLSCKVLIKAMNHFWYSRSKKLQPCILPHICHFLFDISTINLVVVFHVVVFHVVCFYPIHKLFPKCTAAFFS